MTVTSGPPRVRNEHELAVRRELQPVGAAYIGSERLRHLLGRNVDDGHSPVTRIGHPDLFAVGRNVKAFGAVADLHCGLVPIAAGRMWWRTHFPGWSIWLARGGPAGPPPTVFSMMLTVPELTLVVTMRFRSGQT